VKLETLRTKYRDAILAIAAAHNATNVRVFGSTARGKARRSSDIDILIRAEKGCSLLDVCAIENEISDLLNGKKIDVVTEGGLRKELRPFVMKDAVLL
jgi:predicted nucleotidyltransferase